MSIVPRTLSWKRPPGLLGRPLRFYLFERISRQIIPSLRPCAPLRFLGPGGPRIPVPGTRALDAGEAEPACD
jgi:hypothetical protein